MTDEIERECPDMAELRRGLDALSVTWQDESDRIELPSGDDHLLILRTKWEKDGEPVSVIWGYSQAKGNRTGCSYGWPALLECWHVPNDPEPRAMTVDEILEACA